MNILNRITYFFTEIAALFMRCIEWFTGILNTNPLFIEILKILGYLIIALIIWRLIMWLFNQFAN